MKTKYIHSITNSNIRWCCILFWGMAYNTCFIYRRGLKAKGDEEGSKLGRSLISLLLSLTICLVKYLFCRLCRTKPDWYPPHHRNSPAFQISNRRVFVSSPCPCDSAVIKIIPFLKKYISPFIEGYTFSPLFLLPTCNSQPAIQKAQAKYLLLPATETSRLLQRQIAIVLYFQYTTSVLLRERLRHLFLCCGSRTDNRNPKRNTGYDQMRHLDRPWTTHARPVWMATSGLQFQAALKAERSGLKMHLT